MTMARRMVMKVLALLGSQMQFVAVGWDIYERTGQSLQLGLVGLVQVTPPSWERRITTLPCCLSVPSRSTSMM